LSIRGTKKCIVPFITRIQRFAGKVNVLGADVGSQFGLAGRLCYNLNEGHPEFDRPVADGEQQCNDHF